MDNNGNKCEYRKNVRIIFNNIYGNIISDFLFLVFRFYGNSPKARHIYYTASRVYGRNRFDYIIKIAESPKYK